MNHGKIPFTPFTTELVAIFSHSSKAKRKALSVPKNKLAAHREGGGQELSIVLRAQASFSSSETSCSSCDGTLAVCLRVSGLEQTTDYNQRQLPKQWVQKSIRNPSEHTGRALGAISRPTHTSLTDIHCSSVSSKSTLMEPPSSGRFTRWPAHRAVPGSVSKLPKRVQELHNDAVR